MREGLTNTGISFSMTETARAFKVENVQSIHSSVHQPRKYFNDHKAQHHINNISGVTFTKQADVCNNEQIQI